MNPIGITGAKGLLGVTLLREFGKRGLNAVAFQSDIRNKDDVAKEIAHIRPVWIVHAAAMTNVAECEKNPTQAHAVNAEGTANVMEAAKEIGARVIYISTASVFKGDRGDYKEEDEPAAINVYNQTKIEGERATLHYPKAMVLRLNLVGVHPDGSRGKNFAEWLFDSAGTNKDLTLFSDQRINALSNWTAARLIGEIIEKNITERILHIGTHDVISKAEFGKLFLKHFPRFSGHVSEKSIDSIADGVSRPKEMWLNVEKASNFLGPMCTAEEEIKLIYKNLHNF